ncbi:LPXTG cell wall anchor domain-containing protein [Gardnerella sp. 2492-Sm]|uniref:LPXTG cell wall anchor domain-containing protein n=1 Tax=unclassified Gardnerella TaxID=2628112 RepID=UPI003D05D5EC
MANSNSGKHARKVTLDAAVSNAIEKAVDARKVAAFTVGAAGVLAGAAFAFGATPAMAAEAGAAADTNTAPVTAGEKVGKKADAGKAADGKADVKSEVKEDEAKEADKENQTGEKDQTDTNKEAGDKAENTNKQTEKKSENTVNTDGTEDKSTVVRSRGKRSLGSNQTEPTKDAKAENQDRASSGTTNQDPNKIKPAAQADGSTKIDINENNADTVPNAYAWGSSDNTYSKAGETHTVTFHFDKPKDGSKITSIAIFPSKTNGFNNDKSERGIDFYSKNSGKHQAYSGEYTFTPNADGSADLKMTTLFRDGNLNGGAEKYTASRSIFVYVTKDDKEDIAYKTNVFRAVTLVPPKTSGSVVLKYNQELTPEKVQAAITEAGNVETARSDKKSVNDQLSGAFTQNINVKSSDAYDKTMFAAINAKKAGDDNTYVVGAKTLNTYMVTDLGFKSGAIPLTVARYDDRIDKPIVEDPDSVSDDVKTEIKKKLARLNNVSLDQVTINDQGEFTINFAGVDPKDAPKIKLSDLVLKQLEEKDVTVPSDAENSTVKAVIVVNPLGYSNAELKQIKKAIYEANKDNPELGLSATDYEKQITLSYLTGNLTATGHANQGISNGQAENTITVKIKTDKAVAEFTSDVKAHKLTRLADIRKDYTVSWTKDKIDKRDTDEGFSWSEDKKTIIYRYDSTAAKEFDTNKILDLLRATAKDKNSGLRDLTGNEKLDHEGVDGKDTKSHVGYVIDKNGQPTTELSLGNMSGAYWQYSQKVDNSGVDLGDNLSEAGSYSWDEDAKPVFVAAKKGKVYKARLFVLPYGLTMYRNVYMENRNQPWNTPKAINVIFVPQTNHKTSDLKKSVLEHKTTNIEGNEVPTDSAYYNASDKVKKDYEDALKVAQDTLKKVGTTTDDKLSEQLKAEVDNATIKLDKARKALDGAKTDKNGLNASIEADGKAAEGANPASGTQATNQFKNVSDPDFKTDDGKPDTTKNEKAKAAKKAYDEALKHAKELNDDENATQKAVDDAKAKLDAARAKLNDFTTNKDELNNAIAQHGHVNTGDAKLTDPNKKLASADPTYQNSTPEQRDAYDKAVAEAQKVVADPNASQKEVNAAIEALKKAKEALDAKATDKSQLIAAEKLSFDNPVTNDPSKQSTFYKNAKAKAESTDTSVTAEQKAAAKKAYEAYDTALYNARKVIANKDATQAQVNAAKEALTNAEKVLHEKYASNADELTKVLADNFSGYLMPAYFNAFDKAHAGDKDAAAAFKNYNDAYQKAKELKKNLEDAKTAGTAPNQKLIDEAKTALENARKVIDKYATNTSRLSAAVFNHLAIKNSPAYTNVSETDASAEAKAAKDRYDKAVEKLDQALNKQMPKDKQGDTEIPTSNPPDANIDVNNANALDNIQAHANGEPLDRDITSILKEMNDAIAELNKFATKTDELLKSVNEHDNTQQTPAYKNASHPDYKNEDGTKNTDKNGKASKAVDDYGKALNEAKELLKNPAATQKEVNDAKDKLDNARKELDKYNTDITKLEKSVAAHGTETVEGTKDSDAYRNASDPHFVDGNGNPDEYKNQQARDAKTAYDKALAEAQALLAKHNDDKTPQDAKPTQAEIDAALAKLDDARKTLVGDDSALDKPGFGTKTTDLDVEIVKSSAADATTPTPGTVEDTTAYKNALAKKGEKGEENPDITRYKEALNKARELAKKQESNKASERPLQKDVDEAYRALLDAKKIIADGYKTDATALQDEAALGANDGNFTKSPEYKNAEAKKAEDGGDNAELKAYKAALDEVKTMLNNFGKDGKPSAGVDDKDLPTQAQVDAALKKLSDARKAVEATYNTKADKLENEVGDKDETGQDVIPPFEASVPYKNALEKANAESEEDAKKDTSATKKLKDYADNLKAAQDLINKVNNPDPNAKPEDRPTQDDVDKALAALKQAKKDIDDNFKTKVDDLQKEVDDKDETGKEHDPKFENTTEFANLKAKIDGDKKPDDLVAYEQALAKARELIKKNTGKMTDPQDPNKEVDVPKDQLPSQKEVDEALKNLKEIKEKIKKNYVTSPHDLQDEVDKSKDGDKDKRDDVFENTPAFKNATAKGDDAAKQALKDYNDKLAAAKTLLDKFDRTTGKPKTNLKPGEKAPTQKELDDALKALQEAKKKIEDDYSTIKYDLRQEAGKDSDFTNSPEYQNAQAKGDDASKQALEDYKKALDEANSVLADPNATQSEVDAALKKLKAAKDKLRDENGTDKSKLKTEADDDANFRKSVYFIIGNKDDIEAYNTALAEANSVLKDPNATQAQVDEALRKLKAAKYKLNHPFGTGSGSGIGSGYDPNAGDGFAVEANDSQSALVDKSALQVEVNNAVDTNVNTAAARAYRQALAEARRVLADSNATQAQVDEALRNLKAAKAALLNSLRGASGASGLKLAKTGAETSMFASIAAAFAGLGVAGVASRRRKHSNE